MTATIIDGNAIAKRLRHRHALTSRPLAQALDRRVEHGDAHRADARALVARDAVVQAAHRAGDLCPPAGVARIEGEARQLHHRRRPHEIASLRRTGGHAQHAFDTLKHLARIVHARSCQRLREAGIRFTALKGRLERHEIAKIPAAIDDQIADYREVGQRLDQHLRLDRLPAAQLLAAVDHHPAHAAFLDAAEPLVGEAVA